MQLPIWVEMLLNEIMIKDQESERESELENRES